MGCTFSKVSSAYLGLECQCTWLGFFLAEKSSWQTACPYASHWHVQCPNLCHVGPRLCTIWMYARSTKCRMSQLGAETVERRARTLCHRTHQVARWHVVFLTSRTSIAPPPNPPHPHGGHILRYYALLMSSKTEARTNHVEPNRNSDPKIASFYGVANRAVRTNKPGPLG